MRLPTSVAIFSLLLFVVVDHASAQIWQQSQGQAVALGVRDKEGTLGEYIAIFVVKGPDGREHRAQKHMPAGGFGYVHFPSDFNIGGAGVGRHQWVCVVGGHVIARGAFDYDNHRGFTMVAVTPAAATGAATTTQRDARIAKAHADARAIANAVSLFGAVTGRIPATVEDLTRKVQNRQGALVGPFLQTVPSPPAGWSGYVYQANPATGVFTVIATGDGMTVKVP
jgi:hypothetical protein